MARASRARGTRASMAGGRRRVRPAAKSAGHGRAARIASSRVASGIGQFGAGGGHGRGHGMPHGFVSRAQWRYFFANPKLRAKYAHKEAHKTPGGPKVRYRRLPYRKGAPTARSAR